jgi:hypothetical protein
MTIQRESLPGVEYPHTQVPGRRAARTGRALHPGLGRPHPYRLRRKSSELTYPRLADPVNHVVARRDTLYHQVADPMFVQHLAMFRREIVV